MLTDSSATVVLAGEDDGASNGDCSLSLFGITISGGFWEDKHCHKHEYRIDIVGDKQ